MRVLGLTGGIGSGKSVVAQMFARLGAAVIDADQLAREVVEPGQAALQEIATTFGPDVLLPDGRLDRPKLAGIIFADAGERAKLPLAAVFKDQGRASVWLIDEARGRLIKTGVEVNAWTETSAIISDGLTTGEKVVAAGVHKLDAGTPVRIVEVVQ